MRDLVRRYAADWAGIESLVHLGVEEGSDLDFKRERYGHPSKPPEKRNQDRIELRRDIVAFANAEGGIIFIGIAENEFGQASELPGVDDARAAEDSVREILSRDVWPRLGNADLLVRAVRAPSEDGRIVLVISIEQAAPGKPLGLIGEGGVLEFWIREGKSKRPMSHAQVRAAFLGGEELEQARKIDAEAVHDIRRLEREIDDALGKWDRVRTLLTKLLRYAEDSRYGRLVRRQVLEVASRAVEHSRLDMPYDLIDLAFRCIDLVLPLHSLRRPTELTPEDDAPFFFEHAAGEAVDLIYVASKYRGDIVLMNIGGQMLWQLLRFAHLNALASFKQELVAEFASRIDWAAKDGIPGGAELLRFYRDDALALDGDPLPPLPPKLRWVIHRHPKATEVPLEYRPRGDH